MFKEFLRLLTLLNTEWNVSIKGSGSNCNQIKKSFMYSWFSIYLGSYELL